MKNSTQNTQNSSSNKKGSTQSTQSTQQQGSQNSTTKKSSNCKKAPEKEPCCTAQAGGTALFGFSPRAGWGRSFPR